MTPVRTAGAVLERTRRNAIVTWSLLLVLAIIIAETLADGDLLWGGFGIVVGLLILLPPVVGRHWTVMLPWELLVGAVLPLTTRARIQGTPVGRITTHIAIGAVALIIAVELHAFTAVRLTNWATSIIVFITTVATIGLWAIVQWIADTTLGTAYLSTNRELMMQFGASLIAGTIAGLLTLLYFRHVRLDPPSNYEHTAPEQPAHERSESRAPSRRLGIRPVRQQQTVRGLQGVLVGVLVVGLSHADLSIIVNSTIALLVTELPALLKRDLNLTLGPRLTLWLSLAVTIHAVGMLGPYQQVWWWDNIAHTLSASIVAIVGYATIRAVDVHLSTIFLPPRTSVLITLFTVLAAGVLWEVIEFAVSEVALRIGIGPVLIQYGLTDTIVDLIFDLGAGVGVAVWGTSYLTGTINEVVRWLETRD